MVVKLSIINLIVVCLQTQKIFNSHSPLLARRYHENVSWLAGIGFQSLFQAGNAFSESLKGWECLFMGPFEGKQVPHRKEKNKQSKGLPTGRWRRIILHLGELFLGPQKVN